MALSLAAATLGAGALGAGASLFGAGKSASSAKKIAQMQINWERERAQNAIQWGVKDAEKAGLNKIIMAGGTGADTSSINPPMPDTSGYNSAGQIMSDAMKKSAEVKAIESQTDLNSATKGKIEQETTNKAIENSNLDKSIKTDIKKKEAEIAKMNVETKYQQESYNHRLTQQMAETEKAVAEGRIGIDEAKFLEKYGITRQEALTLGVEGMRILFGGIKEGLSNLQIHKQAKDMLKLRQIVKNSAKRR